MLDFPQMCIRLGVALFLGALMGVERELVGKEAGIRTLMLTSSGAAVFSIIALNFPFLMGSAGANNAAAVGMIANIVIAAGFLGAGIIIKTQEHVHGLTSAMMIWTTAGVGVLAGVGMMEFAATVAVAISVILYLLRGFEVARSDTPSK